MQNTQDRWGPKSDHPVILRKKDVQKRVGLSLVRIWELEKRGEFPSRVNLDGRLVGYLENEITEWIHSRVRGGGKNLPAREQEHGRVRL
jgi:prophage regulatory protein